MKSEIEDMKNDALAKKGEQEWLVL
jgi:hypothetical protein